MLLRESPLRGIFDAPERAGRDVDARTARKLTRGCFSRGKSSRDLVLSRIDAKQSLSVVSYDLFLDPVDPLYVLETDARFMGLLY